MKISSIHRRLGYCCPVDLQQYCKAEPINIINTYRCKQRNTVSCCIAEILCFCLKSYKHLMNFGPSSVASILRVHIKTHRTARAVYTNAVDGTASVKSTYFRYTYFYNANGVSGSSVELCLFHVVILSLQFMLRQMADSYGET
jgi:hypothetical protein